MSTQKTKTTHTPGPWTWRKFGEWALCTVHSGALIVLDTTSSRRDARSSLRVRNQKLCLMIPFDADHPDSRLIAAAPDLLAIALDIQEMERTTGGKGLLDLSPYLLRKIYAATNEVLDKVEHTTNQ